MSWPIPTVENTIHCIGDVHFGGGISEFNPTRQARVTADVTDARAVPRVEHHLQLGDLTNTALSSQDTDAMAWMGTLGGTKHHVIGNHDIWDVRDKAQCATDWGLASADYVTDLGFATLIVIGPDVIAPNLVELTFGSTTLNWLDTQLAAATKPVILGAHPPMWNTVGIGGDDDQYKTNNAVWCANPDIGIRAVLADHTIPTAWVSGHTHSPIYAPFMVKAETVGSRTVMAMNTSCLAYVGKTREWTDPLITMYLTVADGAFVTRFRNHGARQWVGAGPDSIRAWAVNF